MVMRKDELEALARQLQATPDPDEREALKRTFVKGVEARSPGVATALSELSNASSLVGEDLTGLHSLYGEQKIEPLSPDAVRSSLDEATRKAPWWRRASARALGAIEWWRKEVTEPSSALTLAAAFKLTPGEQPYDRKIEKARRELAVQQGQAARVDGLSQYVDAATEAYRSTHLPFGTKGFMELVADPLNLIGWGLPAKAGRALPALKPIMFPLRIIDEAPDQLAKRLISVPTSGIKVSARAAEIFPDLKSLIGKGIPGLKDIPGVSAIGKPHLTTQAREAQSRAYASMSELFGTRIADPNPAVTQEILSDLSKFPQDAGPYSVRNLLNHLADTMGYDAWFGTERREGFADRLTKLAPREASETIASMVFGAELKAIREGGTKVSGEAVEGIRPRRVKAISGLLQKLNDDDRWSTGVATGIDNFLNKLESVYVKKVEPLVSRPLALSHLAFTAFPIQNIFEDVGMAAVGLGASPFGVNDSMFRTLTAGLDVPAHLLDNERLMTTPLGGGDRFKPGSKMETILSLGFNKINAKTAKYAWGIRRSALTNLFNKEFGKALRQAGMTEADIASLRQIVEEIPPEARQIAEDIGVMAWLGVSTGSPEAIRGLRQVISSKNFIQRKQSGLLAEYPNLVDEARDLIRQTIFKEGGVSRGNVEQVRAAVREKLLDWHRLTSEEGIQSSYGDAIRAIAERPSRTPEEAQAQIAWLQWASDSLAALPNEIRSNAYLRAQSFPPASPARQRAFQEADTLTGNIIPKLESDFRAAVERVRATSRTLIGEVTKTPAQREVVVRSLDEVFDSYSTISKSVAETRAQSARINDEMFGATSASDRDEAFWLEWRRRQDEIWQREHEVRRRQLNIARTGWNSIFDVVKPSQLTPKGREFMKAGVRSMLGNAEENLDEIAGELRKLQGQQVPESVAAEHARRIEELKKDLVIADQHAKRLRRELENFGQVRTSTQPQELTQYDDAIGLLMREIDHANKVGLSQHIGPLQEKLTQALNEREASFLRIIPDYAKPRYQELTDQRAAILAAPVQDAKGLRRVEREINRFRNSISSGEAGKFAEEVTQVTDVAALRAADKMLAATGGVLPNTLDEAIEVLGRLADSGDEDILSLLNTLESNVGTSRDVFERIYTRAAQRSSTSAMPPLEKQVLRDITTNPDRIPDSVTVRLTEAGALRAGARLSSGKIRFELTDLGKQILDQVPDTNLNVDEILSQLPEPQQRFESSADALLADADSLLDRAVAIADTPPLRAGDEAKVGAYFDKVADELARNPARQDTLKVARQVAWKRAKSEYDRFFIDYDNRSTLDYFMQRLMPFWMYESRRWPRLASLAAKRPVLGKYMTQLGTDWDYGYQPTPYGMEFNPAKGLIVGGLRRTLSRDYPEFHQGWRGKFEEGTDWLARGGFYFAPPISGAFDVISGQPGNILPPPINLVLHGLAGAAGGSVPEPLQTLTYNGRYINFLTDQVLADKFKANPVEIRRGVEDGDPDATAKMDLARRDASARYIAIQQSAMLRYRPQSKRTYIEDTSAAVEELVGVSKTEQDNLRRLGIPLYNVVPVSGFQRKAIREAIPNYDAWIAANNSLRPVEEQKAMRIIDEFWQEQERIQTDFEKQMADLSSQWETNEISGPEAREELSVLQRERANAFQRLKDNPRYSGTVPLTPDERLAWAQRHGAPPPLISPVDEILERYYAITPDRHVDPLTGDTNWGAFFEERESVLADYPTQISDIARTVLRSKNTPMERTLEASKTALRTYFGIRGSLSEELAERDPGASVAYQTYRSLAIAEKKLINYPREQLAVRRQMREIMRHEPELQRLERRVRLIRQDLRRNDPDIATAYGLWVSSPQTTPRTGGVITPRRTSRSIRTI